MEELNMQEMNQRIKELESEVARLKVNIPEDKLSMVVMSGDLDKLLAAFIIATGATAMFEKVTMFFTFWAIAALRDPQKSVGEKDLMGKLFGKMLPKGSPHLTLSRMHMMGMGTTMLKGLMKKKNVLSIEELIRQAKENGVEIYICEMSMNLMGMTMEEMIDYPGMKLAGVAKFLQQAGTSKSTLFI
jgi:peroxiredoxin family protein